MFLFAMKAKKKKILDPIYKAVREWLQAEAGGFVKGTSRKD